MNIQTMRAAERDAREFLRRVEIVKKQYKSDEHVFFGSKETSSLRRQSMELTRSLAELRKR